MSKIEIKKGVKVKCIDAELTATLMKDAVYTVSNHAGEVLYLREKGDIGYRKARFEAVADAEPIKETDFGNSEVYLVEAVDSNGKLRTLGTDIADISHGDLVVASTKGINYTKTTRAELLEVVNLLPYDDSCAAVLQQSSNWVIDVANFDRHQARIERLERKRELQSQKEKLEREAEVLIQEEVRRKTLQDILGNSDAGKALLGKLADLEAELGKL